MHFYLLAYCLSFCGAYANTFHLVGAGSEPCSGGRAPHRRAFEHLLFAQKEPLFCLDIEHVENKRPQKKLSKVTQDYSRMRTVEEMKDYIQTCSAAQLKELVAGMSDEHFVLCYEVLDKRADGGLWKILEKRLKQMKGIEKLSAAAQKCARAHLRMLKQRMNQALSYHGMLNQYTKKNKTPSEGEESALLSAATTTRMHERLAADLEAVEQGATKKLASIEAEVASRQIQKALKIYGASDLPALAAFAQRIAVHTTTVEFTSQTQRRNEYQALLAMVAYQQKAVEEKRISEENAKVADLGRAFNIDPELLKLRYPTQDQNQVILQGTRLMDTYRTNDQFKPIIADASPVIVGLTAEKKTEQARELIECLRMLGQVCKGAQDEMKKQAKSLVAIPAVVAGMHVPLRFLRPVVIPAYALGAILYYVYANAQELIGHVKGLREAVIENRPYDIGASCAKVGLDIAGGSVLFKTLHRLFSSAMRSGCLEDSVKAVTRGIQDRTLVASKELHSHMKSWTDRVAALMNLYGSDLVKEAQEFLHMGFVKGSKDQSYETLQKMVQKIQKLKGNPCWDLLSAERSTEMIEKALVVVAAQEQGYIGDMRYLGTGIFQEESGKLWCVILQTSDCLQKVLAHIKAGYAEHLIVDVTESDQDTYAALLEELSGSYLIDVLLIDRTTIQRSIHIIETTLRN